MAMYYTTAAAPYQVAAANGQFTYDTKEGTAVNPFVGDVVYLQSPQTTDEVEDQRMPTYCARVTTLTIISLSLTLAILTMILLGVSLSYLAGYDLHADGASSAYLMSVFTYIGFVECGCSIVTLVVCLVLTVTKPRWVMARPATHGMNCLCATIFLLFIFSSMSLTAAAFAVYSVPFSTGIGLCVVAGLSSLSKLAYFIDLLAVKCCC